jgi:hypothetical protein
MPERFDDWECLCCGLKHEALVYWDGRCEVCGKSHGKIIKIDDSDHALQRRSKADVECPRCDEETPHERRISAPAKYTYDLPFAPEVYGGKNDTMGLRRPPPLPELPAGKDFNEARDHLNSAQYRKDRKDRLGERMEVYQQNKQKRLRAQAMKKDRNINLRTNPLPGDPKNS